MKQKHLHALLKFTCLLPLCFASCKKTDTPTKQAIDTQTPLLTAGTWKLTKVDGQKTDGTYVSAPFQSGRETETLTFNKDNTITTVDDGITMVGTWQFNAEFSKIFFVDNRGYSSVLVVTMLDKNNLQFNYPKPVYTINAVYDTERDIFTH